MTSWGWTTVERRLPGEEVTVRVLMTGSSGLVGTALTARLREKGDEVVRLVRRPPAAADERHWDPAAGELDPEVVSGFDAVVNLAGAGIGDERWSPAYKELIRLSRVESTRLLAATLASCEAPPRVLVSASAVGFYGDRGDEELDETAAPGDGFLADVVRDWEAATSPAENGGVRVVQLRSGIVLDQERGAVGRMLLPFKLGLGGRIGDGSPWWSWIAIEDILGAIEHVIAVDTITGPVNVAAPVPVRSGEFTKALGRALHRPAVLWVPRIAAEVILGKELAETLVFTSARVAPRVLLDTGYAFVHPTIDTALEALFA